MQLSSARIVFNIPVLNPSKEGPSRETHTIYGVRQYNKSTALEAMAKYALSTTASNPGSIASNVRLWNSPNGFLFLRIQTPQSSPRHPGRDVIISNIVTGTTYVDLPTHGNSRFQECYHALYFLGSITQTHLEFILSEQHRFEQEQEVNSTLRQLFAQISGANLKLTKTQIAELKKRYGAAVQDFI